MFTLHGQTYRVRFQHRKPDQTQTGYTICEIHDGTGPEAQLLSRGAAFRHARDSWRPAIGRRFALDRALRGLPFGQSKQARREFYAAYFREKGVTRA